MTNSTITLSDINNYGQLYASQEEEVINLEISLEEEEWKQTVGEGVDPESITKIKEDIRKAKVSSLFYKYAWLEMRHIYAAQIKGKQALAGTEGDNWLILRYSEEQGYVVVHRMQDEKSCCDRVKQLARIWKTKATLVKQEVAGQIVTRCYLEPEKRLTGFESFLIRRPL